MLSRLKRLLLFLGCLGLLVGCGGTPSTVAVRLPVTVNGRVPTGANVTLHPQGVEWSEKLAHRPFGKVAEDGTVKFSTFQSGDGVPPGEYVVCVHWPAAEGRDVLGGEHADPARPNPLRITVATSGDLPPLTIQTRQPLRGFK